MRTLRPRHLIPRLPRQVSSGLGTGQSNAVKRPRALSASAAIHGLAKSDVSMVIAGREEGAVALVIGFVQGHDVMPAS